MRSPCAQLRFSPEHLTWTFRWPNRDDRWLAYDRIPPTANFHVVLRELDEDPYCCFWG